MFKFTDTKAVSEMGAWVHLKDGAKLAYLDDKDGKPDLSKPVRIKVLGPDSPTLQAKLRKRVALRLKASGGSADISKMNAGQIEALLEERKDTQAENWADATIDWENIPNDDGTLLNFTHSAAESLYIRFPAIVRQISDDAADIEDFLELAANT